MKQQLYLLLYLFLCTTLSLPFTSSATSGKKEEGGGTPPPLEAIERHAQLVANKSHDVILRKDKYSFLEARENSSCLSITNSADIPEIEHGTQSYGEECELPPATRKKCRRFSTAPDDSKAEGSAVECLKRTHLFCDPTSMTCLCSSNNMLLVQKRFQFGNENGKNLTHGRCLIRPTFDVIAGFECTPGTEPSKVLLEQNVESLNICGCLNQNETDKFNTTDPDWWKCTAGCWAVVDFNSGILLFSLFSYLSF